MTAIGEVQILKREDIPDAPDGEYIDKLLTALSTNSQNLRTAVTGIPTNLFTTQQVTHNTPLRIKNPLGSTRPTGVVAIASDGGTLPQVAWSMLNSTTQPDQLMLTPTFAFTAAAVGENITVVRTTNQAAISSGVQTAVTWSGVVAPAAGVANAGAALSWNGTTGVNLIKPGLYQIIARVAYPPTAALAGDRACILASSVTGQIDLGLVPGSATASNNAFAGTNAIYESPGGESVGVTAYQSSGAAIAVLGGGTLAQRVMGGTNRTFMQVVRIRNDESIAATSANVTFMVIP